MEFNLCLQKYKFPFILASKICGIFFLKDRKAKVPCKAYEMRYNRIFFVFHVIPDILWKNILKSISILRRTIQLLDNFCKKTFFLCFCFLFLLEKVLSL